MIASLATIPGREKALRECCESLSCTVFVYNNGNNPDLGDAGKFAVSPESGYHIVCDDDLVYSDEYMALMIRAVDRYDRAAVITLQGRVLHRRLESYYNDRGGQTKYSLQEPLKEDAVVDIAGTGVMAYHTDALRFSMRDFPHKNMADPQASLKCARAGVPIICAAHTGEEVKLSKHVDHMNATIWTEAHLDDAVQTGLANEIYGLKLRAAA